MKTRKTNKRDDVSMNDALFDNTTESINDSKQEELNDVKTFEKEDNVTTSSNEVSSSDNEEHNSQKNDFKKKKHFSHEKHNNNFINYSEIDVNDCIKMHDYKNKSVDELIDIANELGIQNTGRMLKAEIVCAIMKKMIANDKHVISFGILEIADDGFGFLRSVENDYKNSPDDIYVSQNMIRNFCLRTGDKITCFLRIPKMNERYFSCGHITHLEDVPMSEVKKKGNFDNLTPIFPTEKLIFDKSLGTNRVEATRVIDLTSPIGKGQRALIVAPPRTGKTVVLQDIARAINQNNPEVHLIFLGIDERPEEVTEIKRTIIGDVISSTFDESPHTHVMVSNIAIERAKRMVEAGKDVVILLDSITRLARAYNTVVPSSGKVLTGGVDANALQKPKKFFGAARNIENGGSLTIIASALIETGSKMDEVIFEEFKGTGNSEIVLDRNLANRRIFPAIDVLKSGTRREEEMVKTDEMKKIFLLRKLLIQMSNSNGQNSNAAIEFLIDKLKKTQDNQEFFDTMTSIAKSS